MSPEVLEDEEIEVKHFADNEGWKVNLLGQYLLKDIVHYITTIIISP